MKIIFIISMMLSQMLLCRAETLVHFLPGTNTHLNWAYFENSDVQDLPYNWRNSIQYNGTGIQGRIVNSLGYDSYPLEYPDGLFRLTYALGTESNHASSNAIFPSFVMATTDDSVLALEKMSFNLGFAAPEGTSMGGTLSYQLYARIDGGEDWIGLTGSSLEIAGGLASGFYGDNTIEIDFANLNMPGTTFQQIEFGLCIHASETPDPLYATLSHIRVEGNLQYPSEIPESKTVLLLAAGFACYLHRKRRRMDSTMP